MNQTSTDNTTTWSDAELQMLRDAFRLLDTEQRGTIAVCDLQDVLVALEETPVNRLLRQSLNESTQMTLTLEEFLRLLTSPHVQDTRDDDEKVFNYFDVHSKGYIDQQDLRAVAADLGEGAMTDAELQEMIQWASASSGRVSLDQFREILHARIVR
jgi:Ca2+-binding EF-hand superfamily protein